jgi:hypothetical protein
VVQGGTSVSSAGELSLETDVVYNELDSEDMIETFVDLYQDAQKVLDFFNIDTSDRTALSPLGDSSSSQRKRFNRQFLRFMQTCACFGVEHRLTLSPELIVRKLQAENPATPEGRWRPDAVVYLANIAILLGTVVAGDEAQIEALLQRIWVSHPALFMPTTATSRFSTFEVEKTVSYSITLRTQMFIRRVKSVDLPQEDLMHTLFQFFLYDGKNYSGLEIAGEDKDRYAAMIKQHLQGLDRFFLPDDGSLLLENLEEEFSWLDFVYETIKWGQARLAELQESLRGQGGIEDIVDRLQQGDLKTAYPGKPAQARDPHSRNHKALIVEIQRKKEAAQRAAAASSARSEPDSQSQDEIPQSVSELDNQYANVDDGDAENIMADSGVPDAATQAEQAGLVLDFLNDQDKEAVKENFDPKGARPPRRKNFVDRQPGAQRLTFNDDNQISEQRHSSKTRGKRPATVDSEDSDFQIDSRPPRSKRVQLQDVIDPTLDSIGAPQIEDNLGDGSEHAIPSAPTPLPATQTQLPFLSRTGVVAAQPAPSEDFVTQATSRPPSSSAPNPAPARADQQDANEYPTATWVQNVQERAKHQTRERKFLAGSLPPPSASQSPPRSTQTNQRGYQQRQAWEPAETQRLMDLIAVHSTAYATILKEDAAHRDGPLLQHRNQVQLKDKARNIKFAFYKAHENMPMGFESVSLGLKFVKKLEELGIAVVVRQLPFHVLAM